MACSGRYATAAEYFAFFCGSNGDCYDPEEESIVNEFLEKAAADVHAAVASAACT